MLAKLCFIYTSSKSGLQTPTGITIIVAVLMQPLARMGATVTGIDAVEKNINIARLHAVCFLVGWI